MSQLWHGIGVATISLAQIIPAAPTEVADLEEYLSPGCVGAVGTFWYGYHETIGETDQERSAVGALVSGLVVPRMVEVARHNKTLACSFVASVKSGEPDVSSSMREHMIIAETGLWLSPVHNPDVEYDLLVA